MYHKRKCVDILKLCHPILHSEIDECQDPNACAGNATCLNTVGNYTCTCNMGYELPGGVGDAKTTACQCEYILLVWEILADFEDNTY